MDERRRAEGNVKGAGGKEVGVVSFRLTGYLGFPCNTCEECTDDDLVPGNPPASSFYDTLVVGLPPALLDYARLNTAFGILVGENRPRDGRQHHPRRCLDF